MKPTIFFAFLVALSLATTIAEHEWTLSNSFTLSLNYAARAGKPLATSSFNIIWNGQTVKEVTPANYNLNHLTLTLIAKVGNNEIKFAGAGPSDSFGATISDISLQRPSGCRDGDEDLIVNGNFEKGTNVGKGWKLFKGRITGWEGPEIEIGHGKIYNSNWKDGAHVCELDANGNTFIRQEFQFDRYFREVQGHNEPETSKPETSEPTTNTENEEGSGSEQGPSEVDLSLSFDYANRNRVPFNSQGFSVYWNNQKVKTINTHDYNIHHVVIPVKGRVGVNTLRFSGEGRSDGLGTTYTNVRLLNGSRDLIINGNFNQPNVGRGWRIFNTIPGWTGGEIEVGWGRIYNPRWSPSTHINELDGRHNDNVIQTINLDENFNRK